MALGDKLNTIDTIENLATNKDFLEKLITELSKGNNNRGIYTKKGVDDALKNKADKNYVDTELEEKADTSALGNKANTADVYTKTDANTAFVKATELKTKVAEKAVVDAITASSDFTNKVYIKADQADEVYTKTAADTAFVKATELKTKVAEKAVVDAITASSDFTGKVYTKTAADTAFVKATELKTKAAAKDVVDAITASSDFTDKVYTKTAADTAFVKTADLKTKAAEKDVVEAIFDAKDGNDKISETKVGTTFAKKTDLNNKVNVIGDNATEAGVNAMLGKLTGANVVVKINASNLTDAANQKAFAEAILPAKDGDKSILVDKLGEFLDNSTDNKYGAKSDQTAKVFLGGKGLKGDQGNTGPKGEKGDPGPKGADGKDGTSPSAAEIAAEQALQEHVTQISIQSPEFKKAVQEEMSQPHFDIPESNDAALNWTW